MQPIPAPRAAAPVSRGPHLLDRHVAYIEKMVAQGGPAPPDYAGFQRWLSEVAAQHRTGRLSKHDIKTIRAAFQEALSMETLQGFSYLKPHGYTGDFEIIDRMYTGHLSANDHLRNWDVYFQTQKAPTAVRNRKAYFLRLARSLGATFPEKESLPVLNVASGPARDVFEFFEGDGGHKQSITFDCVDTDGEAISYAEALCAPHLSRIAFHQANALRFVSPRKYQLIWSAGLFDYLGDKGFGFLLERLLTMLREDGELVVGNFAPSNPTKDYMELVGDWNLYYRDEEDLIEIAERCGAAPADIRIGKEPEGVNLFLHIKRGRRFLTTT